MGTLCVPQVIIFRVNAKILRKTALRVPTDGRLPPLRSENKNCVLSFSHYNKMNLVNGYIFRLQGFCLFRIIYKPRERILSAHGVCRLKCLIGYRFFQHGNLSANEHAMQFFYAKTLCFLRRFPYRSRRGGNLPPSKMRSIFPLYTAHLRGYNRGEAA